MLAAQDPNLPLPAPPDWRTIEPSHLWRWPLADLSRASDRLVTRLAGRIALGRILDIQGWEHILPMRDPFVLVTNHRSRREALLLPTVLMLARGGRPVRFLADWNFRLIPGIGHLYDRGGVITLTRKDARPRFLNRLKPLFEPSIPPYEEARRHLLEGGSVGIFPEGSVNRGGARLLRGRWGAARLSLEAGVPVVPVGIRFARRDAVTGAVDSASPMSLHFSEALPPPRLNEEAPSRRDVIQWHAELMTAIALLCGKS